MKKIKIKYWNIINKKMKKNEENLVFYGETFHELLNVLFKKYESNLKDYFLDAEGINLSSNIIVFINNKPVRDLQFKLKNRDEVLIMPNIEGG